MDQINRCLLLLLFLIGASSTAWTAEITPKPCLKRKQAEPGDVLQDVGNLPSCKKRRVSINDKKFEQKFYIAVREDQNNRARRFEKIGHNECDETIMNEFYAVSSDADDLPNNMQEELERNKAFNLTLGNSDPNQVLSKTAQGNNENPYGYYTGFNEGFGLSDIY